METRYPRPHIWFRLPANTRAATPAFPMATNVELAVTKFNTNMQLANPEGSWSITFVSTPDGVTADDLANGILPAENEFLTGQGFWYNKIDKMDLVGIAMGAEKPYFYGLVTDKRRSFQLVQDRPVAAVTISGIALGGIFNRQNVMYLPTVEMGAQELYGFLANTVFGERPWIVTDTKMRMDLIIKTLFTKFQALDIRFSNPDGSLWDYFDFASYISPVLSSLFTTKMDYLQNFSGTLWGIAREFAPGPFFEMWFDVKPSGDKVALYARVPPFSYRGTIDGQSSPELSWDVCLNPGTSKAFTEIIPDEITGIELGESSSEAFSIFYIRPVGQLIGDTEILQRVPPIMSERLCKKYGVRAFQTEVAFLAYDPTEKNLQDTFRFAGEWRDRIAEWYLLNDQLQAGSLTIEGRTDVRIGHKISVRGLPEGSRQFYVEGVAQDWMLNNSWVTKLTVTRGSTKKMREDNYWETVELSGLVSNADKYLEWLRARGVA